MLIIFTTCLLLLVGVSLAILLKKLSDQNLLDEPEPRVPLEAESFRPLFAPTDDELRLAAAEEKRLLTAKDEQTARHETEEKLKNLAELRENWSYGPTRGATIDLLHRASQVQSGDAYTDTCEAILAAWNDGKLPGIDAGDLAQLLETHFWLLPADQRTPGASFRMKEAVAKLRNTKM